jgi:hypothetical protein
MRAALPFLCVSGVLLATLAAVAPPATTLGVVLFIAFSSSAATMRSEKAIALLWWLSVLPLYLNLPSVAFPIPLELVVALILLWRTFVVERRALSFGTASDQLLTLIVLCGAGLSTVLSQDKLRSSLNFLSLAIWLLLIPLARATYRRPEDARLSMGVLGIAVGVQALLGFAQLVGGRPFTTGILTSPLAAVFFNNNALLSRLVRQDFNWAMFGWAFPSGLFINAIVYGLCLTTAALILLNSPPSWLPRRGAGALRASAVLGLLAAFASFKVTAWVAIATGGVLLLAHRPSRSEVRLRTVAVPLLLLVAAAGLTRELVTTRLTDVAGASALTRLIIWIAYLQALVYGGWIGVGPGQAEVLAPTLPTWAAGQNVSLLAAPENSWVGLAVEIGVPATAALLIVLVRLGVRGRPLRVTVAGPAIAAALVGCTIGVHGLTDEHILPLVALIGGVASTLNSLEASGRTATLAPPQLPV